MEAIVHKVGETLSRTVVCEIILEIGVRSTNEALLKPVNVILGEVILRAPMDVNVILRNNVDILMRYTLLTQELSKGCLLIHQEVVIGYLTITR